MAATSRLRRGLAQHPVWNTVGALAAVAAILLGVFMWFVPNYQSITGTGPSSGCQSGFSDEFDGDRDGRWIWVDYQGTATLGPSGHGTLRMTAPNGSDLLPKSTTAPRLLQSVAGDFTVETHVYAAPSAGYQGAGLLLWQDGNDYVRLELGYGGFRGIELSTATDGAYAHLVDAWTNGSKSIPTWSDDVYLKLRRTGDHVTAWWRDSTTGAGWQYVGDKLIHLDPDVQVGVDVVSVSREPSATAEFDYFHFACI